MLQTRSCYLILSWFLLLQVICARSLFQTPAKIRNQVFGRTKMGKNRFNIENRSICFLDRIYCKSESYRQLKNGKQQQQKETNSLVKNNIQPNLSHHSKISLTGQVILQARANKYTTHQDLSSLVFFSRSFSSRIRLSMVQNGNEDSNLQGYNGYGNPSDDMGFAIPPDIEGSTLLNGPNEKKLKSVDVRRQERDKQMEEKLQELKECYLLDESEIQDQIDNSSPVVLGYQEDAKDATKHPELIVNMTRPLGISIEETLDKRTQMTEAVWLAEVDNPSAIKQGLSIGDVIIGVSFMFDDRFLIDVEGKSMDEIESYISCRQLPYVYIRVRKGHTYHIEAMEEEEEQRSKTPDQIEEENEKSQLKWYDLRKEVFADYYPVDLSCIDSIRYDSNPVYRPGDFSPSPDDTRDRDGPIILPPEEIERDEQEWD